MRPSGFRILCGALFMALGSLNACAAQPDGVLLCISNVDGKDVPPALCSALRDALPDRGDLSFVMTEFTASRLVGHARAKDETIGPALEAGIIDSTLKDEGMPRSLAQRYVRDLIKITPFLR